MLFFALLYFAYMFIICYTICSVIVKIPIFIKAKKSPWLAIIPIISDFILLEICFNNIVFAWIFCFTMASLFFIFWFTLCIISPVVLLIMNLIIEFSLSMFYFMCLKTAKNFGKGKLFALGLFFLWPIFLLILAFDKSKYLPSEKCLSTENDNFDGDDNFIEKNNYLVKKKICFV